MVNFNISIKYGLYGALVGMIIFLILIFTNNSPWSSASWMACWIPGVTAYFALKEYNSLLNEKLISFSMVLRRSMMVIFFQALFYNAIVSIIALLFNTHAVEMYQFEMMQNASHMKSMVGQEVFTQIVKELESISFITLAFWDMVYKIIGGFLITLFMALILKRNNPVLDS